METIMLITLTIIVVIATTILIYLFRPRSPRGEILPEINGKQLIVHYDPQTAEYQFKCLRDIYDKEAGASWSDEDRHDLHRHYTIADDPTPTREDHEA